MNLPLFVRALVKWLPGACVYSWEIIKCENLARKFHTRRIYSLLTGPLTMLWNNIACVLATACIGEKTAFRFVTMRQTVNPSLQKIIRKRAQICDSCSIEYFALLSRLDVPDAGSVTRIAFKYKFTSFRINFSKMISLSIILCLFIHNSGSKHSRKTKAQASLQRDLGE